MNATTEVGEEVVNVTKDLGTAIGNVISTMAEKLSVPVAHVYEVFTKQQVIEGWSYIIGLLTGVIFFTIIIVLAYKSRNKIDKHEKPIGLFCEENFALATIVIFSLIPVATTMLIFLANLQTVIGKIINPEYFVIQDITQMVKDIMR